MVFGLAKQGVGGCPHVCSLGKPNYPGQFLLYLHNEADRAINSLGD